MRLSAPYNYVIFSGVLYVESIFLLVDLVLLDVGYVIILFFLP